MTDDELQQLPIGSRVRTPDGQSGTIKDVRKSVLRPGFPLALVRFGGGGDVFIFYAAELERLPTTHADQLSDILFGATP